MRRSFASAFPCVRFWWERPGLIITCFAASARGPPRASFNWRVQSSSGFAALNYAILRTRARELLILYLVSKFPTPSREPLVPRHTLVSHSSSEIIFFALHIICAIFVNTVHYCVNWNEISTQFKKLSIILLRKLDYIHCNQVCFCLTQTIFMVSHTNYKENFNVSYSNITVGIDKITRTLHVDSPIFIL